MVFNNFKSDESFLEKLAKGAVGTKATIHRLQELGYDPIELERGSTGYKLWKSIKIKRVRVPDILCLKSGVRVEARAKTNLEISMSHSTSNPNRAWDTGMRPDDLVAFVVVEKSGERPIDWQPGSPVHFVRVRDMQLTYENNQVQVSRPKGVEEGSEVRVIWSCAVANERSNVRRITDTSVFLESLESNKSQQVRLRRPNVSLNSQVQVGDIVAKNQIVASIVPIHLSPFRQTEVNEQYFVERLHSVALSERYAAAKALRFRGGYDSREALLERMNDEVEDIYVKLEAAAALAVQGQLSGWSFLANQLKSEYETVQLETVIVLSEIVDPNSEALLVSVLVNPECNTEVRAGAAWALGEFHTHRSATALIDTFNLTAKEIKVEAARALLKLAPFQVETLIEALRDIDPSKRDGVAWALAKAGNFDINMLRKEPADRNLRQWISYIAGFGKERFLEEHIAELCAADPEIHFAASVLWQLLASWIYGLDEY